MKKQGFSRRCRMTERREFVRLFEAPEKKIDRAFQAYWKPNDRQTARLGITIKGKLSSVWRMRLKRVIREWFRVAKPALGNNDVNIVIRIPKDLDDAFELALKTGLRKWKA